MAGSLLAVETAALVHCTPEEAACYGLHNHQPFSSHSPGALQVFEAKGQQSQEFRGHPAAGGVGRSPDVDQKDWVSYCG